MSLLQILNNACAVLRLDPPSSVVGNDDPYIRELLTHANIKSRDIGKDYAWTQLKKKAVITLVAGQSYYSFTDDFDRFLPCSAWEASRVYPLFSISTSAREYSAAYSLSSSYAGFHISGCGGNEIEIYPNPTTADAGRTLSYWYITKSVIGPYFWAPSSNLTVNSYVMYGGNNYLVITAGQTSITPPTHTTGSANNGTAVLQAYQGAYDNFRADTDSFCLNEDLLYLATVISYSQSINRKTDVELDQYGRLLRQEKGARVLGSPLGITPYISDIDLKFRYITTANQV